MGFACFSASSACICEQALLVKCNQQDNYNKKKLGKNTVLQMEMQITKMMMMMMLIVIIINNNNNN